MPGWICVAAVSAAIAAAPEGQADARAVAADRAVKFLCQQVPLWSRDNHCFSCHNNGDAARALYIASRSGHEVPADALAETTRWLLRADGWNKNGGDGPFNDRRLARVVFTATLETAVATRWVTEPASLARAAAELALDQAPDGSWTLEGEDDASSPAGYGRSIATLMARDALAAADSTRFRSNLERANAWLFRRDVQTITDASVFLLAYAGARSNRDETRLARCLDLLRRGQSRDGGWGPLVNAPPEPFDTAFAILALARAERSPETRAMLARGQAFLVAEQQKDGSWTETTRPAGNISYAQRISTTGWATLALLAGPGPATGGSTDTKR
jgi:hypothetical protein